MNAGHATPAGPLVRLFNASLLWPLQLEAAPPTRDSGRFDHFLRISCGTPFNPNIEAAIRRLGQIVAAGG